MAELQTEYWPGTKATAALSDARRAGRAFGAAASHGQPNAEKDLAVAASRLKAVFGALSDLAFVIKKGGFIAEFHAPANPDALFTPEDVTGKKIMDLLPASLGQQAMYYLEKTLHTGRPQAFSVCYELGGKTREFQARLAPSHADEVIALVRDVTDCKRLEREILEISNREQMRIGQDLHDGLGQHLTGITFLTRALENNLAAKALPEAAEAAEIGKLVLQALTQTRSLARGLFPVELEASGLAPALQELAATIENTFGINCRFEGEETLSVPNQVIASHLFRLTQEAVNNSIKHGKANTVVIDLQKETGSGCSPSTSGERIVLSIRDDGAGLPKEALKTKGLGLRIMSYRAQKIGGVFEIKAGEEGGTVVTCAFSNRRAEDKNFETSHFNRTKSK